MRAFLLFTFTFFIPSLVFSDSIVLKDGSIYSGKILGSTGTMIRIETSENIENIPESEVLSLLFSNADILYFKNKSSVECKILRKTGDSITILTLDGEKVVDNKEIKSVKYNIGHELKVTSLSITDQHFKNKPNRFIWTGKFQKNIYLGLNLGSQYSSLDSWKEQFYFENDKISATTGFQLGGEIGIIINKYLELGIGYQRFLFPTVKVTLTLPNFEDRVSASFYYGSLKIGHYLEKIPDLRIYCGIDLGYLNGIEKIHGLEGMDLEASGKIFAQRFKIGSAYFHGNFALFFEIGYLLAKVSELDFLGKEVPDYDLDISGLSLITGLKFYFPIQTN